LDDSQIFQLETERTLGYAEYGVKGGHPVFYFHGYPGSRLEAGLMKDQWEHNDIHQISVDRPGMGLSDYQSHRTILDQPDDVMELAAHLGLEEYGVLGMSGSGPYAFACTYRIPSEQITSCAVVSGSGPYYLTQEGLGKGERYMLSIAKNFPLAFRFLLWLQLGRNVKREERWEKNYAGMTAGAPEPDERILNEPRVKENIKAKTVEAFRQGSKGLVHDFVLYSKDWGFELSEIPADNRLSLPR
jgi:pimeloyl-ACP methyl ester carboxylesterase